MNDDLIDRSDDPQLGRSLGLSRRQLLAATTGMAAAAALGAAAIVAGSTAHPATRAGKLSLLEDLPPKDPGTKESHERSL